ncbi:hypothetical protein CDV31_010454 [Fusarium ambrosium]|uniref:Uncharacterized protein n=1 Tax=Fusarium ambrosium TaxID=131363 RepID=A0A428TN91_9HYPO|nr:hypothetical protein CDV31_010454 [Fusarium ambrosium]
MASESKPQSFHFVCVSNPSTSSISQQGRSFVTGNVRAGSSWSTKSAKPQDKRKSKRIARSTAVVLPKDRVLRSQAKDQNDPPQSFKLYSYPESSFFFTESTVKVSSWCKAGIHHGLREFLITADCLLKDTSAWLRQPDSYKWDLLGVQSLYGLAIEMFPRWRYEASPGATNADQLVALFTAVLIFFISNNGQLLDYIPMHLSDIQDLVSDPRFWPTMRAAGLDLWLAFLLVLSSSHQAAYRDYFFRMHASILEAHEPKTHSVEEYVQNLHDTLWLPQRLDKYARQLWYRTEGETEQQW